MNKNYFRNLCIKEFSNNISELEKQELKKLLESSEKYLEEFNELKSTWENAAPTNLQYEMNIDSEWEKFSFQEKAVDKKSESNNMRDKINSIFIPKLKPALAFGSVMVIIFALFLTNPFEKEAVLKTLKTGNGERLEVLLSDGSTVNINNGSEIIFFENFSDDKREITLNGEAFFSIKKDGRPFIIKTKNAITTVLGTKFNVWARNNETRVVVKEGKVSLADDLIPENKVFLEKDQTSAVVGSSQPTKVKNIDSNYSLGWMDGKLIFEDADLVEVIDELQRYYNKPITLNNENTENLTLTGKFDNEDIDSVLTKICLALNLKYVEEQNVFNITK